MGPYEPQWSINCWFAGLDRGGLDYQWVRPQVVPVRMTVAYRFCGESYLFRLNRQMYHTSVSYVSQRDQILIMQGTRRKGHDRFLTD